MPQTSKHLHALRADYALHSRVGVLSHLNTLRPLVIAFQHSKFSMLCRKDLL